MENYMKKPLFFIFILVFASVAVFSTEQNYNLKVIKNDSTMGILVTDTLRRSLIIILMLMVYTSQSRYIKKIVPLYM